MTRLRALAAALLAAPLALYGCAPSPGRQAETSCERLGLNVRVLDGELAQDRLVLGAATRRRDQPASSLHLMSDPPADPGAEQALRDRRTADLDAMQGRLVGHQAALDDARTRAAQCSG
jgi:hypothetical protein